LTVFGEWYTKPIVKNTPNYWCTNRHRSTKTVPTVYQRCTNSQKQSKDSQNSKNDHWCTNRHMSTKTLPTVYQQCTKNSQKTVKTAKMTIGVPNVTSLPRLYQQCNNSLPIVNKNLAIANRSRVRPINVLEDIHRPKYYTVTLKSR